MNWHGPESYQHTYAYNLVTKLLGCGRQKKKKKKKKVFPPFFDWWKVCDGHAAQD